MRGNERGAAEEGGREQQTGDAPDKGEEQKAAAGGEPTTTAGEEDSAVVSGGEGGVDGDRLSEADAPAVCPATPAPRQAGKEAAAAHEGRGPGGEEVVRAGAKDSQGANRESGGGHDQAEDESLASGQSRAGGTMSDGAREAEAEPAGEQVRLQRVYIL